MSQAGRMRESADPWPARRVAVLGGTGFIGSHLVEQLLLRGAHVRVVTRRAANRDRFLGHLGELDVVEADCAIDTEVRVAVRSCDTVMHLAAAVAGVAMNRTRPAWMFANSARLIVPVFEACVSENVERVLYVSSACVYPGEATIPTLESEGFHGDPEVTNLGYGWAKRMGEVAARLYAAEYGLRVGIVRPYNAYGPRDDFDTRTSNVIPSLIRRVHEDAGDLVVWGSGTQTRSFIYVDDLVEGLILASECAQGVEPVNLGSSEEVSIGEVARRIVELSGRPKRIVFDASRPDGQARRQPDLRRAAERLGFRAQTTITDGLRRTIDHYQRTLAVAAR